MLSKAQKWASISIGALLLGNKDGRFFLGAFLLAQFLLGPLEIYKMPCRRLSLSIGAPLWNLERVRLLGILSGKKSYIWVPFLHTEVIKILSLEAIWDFDNRAGLSTVDMRLWGTKGTSTWSRCLGTVKVRNQC